MKFLFATDLLLNYYTMSFLSTYTARRTLYSLKPELPASVTIEQVQAIVQDILKHTPTSFNSQTIRAVIITGALHKQVWDSVINAIETDSGKKRPTSCRDEAFGTVVFFDDSAAIKKIQDAFPPYKDYFPTFSTTSNGAAQVATWAALQEIGLGGHLQHFNGYVQAALAGKVPESWNVQAQLVFGVPTAAAGDKSFDPENVVKVLS